MVLFFTCCTTSYPASLPLSFNNCEISLDESLEIMNKIESDNEIKIEIRIVKQVTDREECIDMVLGTNLIQGSELKDGDLVDLVVGIKKNAVTESLKLSEYELYLQQLSDKGIEGLNLIEAPNFGEASIDIVIEGQNIVSFIRVNNPLNFNYMFSETEGFIYGVDSEKNVVEVLDLSDQTRTQRESGLHTFDFMNLNSKDYLVVTYTGVDNKYHLSAFEVLPDLELGNEESLAIISDGNVETTKIHWGGKILQKDQEIILCLGDLESPGHSAKFDTLWGKVFSISNVDLLDNPLTEANDPRINYLAFGLRNPWSCFFQNDSLIIPDVGNSHWEEINIIDNINNIEEPVFFGWPWFESYFNANYPSTPVDIATQNELIESTVFPNYVFPHGNDYCAVIGGTELTNSTKWKDYFFVGDFCTGTIWAINVQKASEVIVLEKNLIPYSITTINDSGNETLLVGTTSGQIIEVTLP